jgi:hypothetical protein
MANTRLLSTAVEDHVRHVLGQRYGADFERRQVRLMTGGLREFGAVATDASVVASIKTASGLTSGGKLPVGKIHSSVAELYFLSLVEAPVRLLVLTTPDFHELFTRALEDKMAPGIEVICEPLPKDLQAEVEAVQRVASREVSPVQPTPIR